MATSERSAEADVVLGALVDVVLHATHHDLLGALRPALAPLGETDCEIMLADYAQQVLTATASDQDRCPIEGTVSGEAYTSQTIRHEPLDGGARVWLPISDGAARFGVMRLDVASWNPPLGTVATRLAGLVAQKLTRDGQRTDLVTQRRRRKYMTLGSDMQWRLLPPSTASNQRTRPNGVGRPGVPCRMTAVCGAKLLQGCQYPALDQADRRASP